MTPFPLLEERHAGHAHASRRPAAADPRQDSAPHDSGAPGYLALSRTRTYSLTFALPLLLLYESLVLQLHRYGDAELRNLGDWFVRGLLGTVGIRGPAGVTAALIVAAVALIAHEQARAPVPIRPRLFAVMALESVALALAFGSVVRLLTMGLLAPLRLGAEGGLAPDAAAAMTSGSPSPIVLAASAQLASLPMSYQLVLALGAGIYEELVFRALAITALTAAIGTTARLAGAPMPRGAIVAIAVVVSSLLFSLLHYVGPLGDPLGLWSFAFRFTAGLAFSAIYALRGFGIVAWTHALYDVLLIVATP